MFSVNILIFYEYVNDMFIQITLMTLSASPATPSWILVY